MYNVDLKSNNDICCCDAPSSTCSNDLLGFSTNTCDPRCDTYFDLSFMECQDISPCPLTMTTDVSTDSDTTTNVNYEFSFNVSSCAIEPVRVWVFVCDHTLLFINNNSFYKALFIRLMLVNGFWEIGCNYMYSSKFPFNNNPFIAQLTMIVTIFRRLALHFVQSRCVPSFLS